MRLRSLIILLALVGGVTYVAVFQRDWFFSVAEEGKHRLQGYRPAETPSAAAEKFLEAVKARDYRAAALYVSDDYAEQLRKSADAASTLGDLVDRVRRMAKERGFSSPNARGVLYRLDPFPTDFKVKDVKKVTDKKRGERHIGYYAPEDTDDTGERVVRHANFKGKVDGRMFVNALHPGPALLAVEIRREAEGQPWKLQLPLTPERRQAIAFFNEHWRSYRTGLENATDLTRQGRFLPATYESELLTILGQCKSSS